MPTRILHDSYMRTQQLYENAGFRFRPGRVRVSRGLFQMLQEDNLFLLVEFNPAHPEHRFMSFRGARIELGSNDPRPVVETWIDARPLQRLIQMPRAQNLWVENLVGPPAGAEINHGEVLAAAQSEPEPEVVDVDFN